MNWHWIFIRWQSSHDKTGLFIYCFQPMAEENNASNKTSHGQFYLCHRERLRPSVPLAVEKHWVLFVLILHNRNRRNNNSNNSSSNSSSNNSSSSNKNKNKRSNCTSSKVLNNQATMHMGALLLQRLLSSGMVFHAIGILRTSAKFYGKELRNTSRAPEISTNPRTFYELRVVLRTLRYIRTCTNSSLHAYVVSL